MRRGWGGPEKATWAGILAMFTSGELSVSTSGGVLEESRDHEKAYGLESGPAFTATGSSQQWSW